MYITGVIFFLGTHDFQDVSISSDGPGDIRVTGYFIEGSTATGVLVAMSTTSEVYFHMFTREGTQSQFANTVSNVAGGDYSVSVFVEDENGLPFNRSATIPQNVTVVKGKRID